MNRLDDLKEIVSPAILKRAGDLSARLRQQKYPGLVAELRLEEGIPVISLRGLVLMKLAAFRARDQEDVRALLRLVPQRLREVRDYLQVQAPELLTRLGEVLAG